MTIHRPLVSIICPAFNEIEVLPPFHRALVDVLGELADDYLFEILYVDDGSSDDTIGLIKSLAAQDERIRWFSFSRNFGHQAALSAGMEHARGDAVITMDSDLQHPPELIPALLQRWKDGFDVVLTVRENDPTLSAFKRWTSNGFYHVLRWSSDVQIAVAAADFRLLSRKALDSLIQMREVHRFLRGMVHWIGFSTAEIRYTPGQRAAGKSHYSLRKMLRLAGDGIFAFSLTPVRMLTGLGLTIVGLGVLMAGVILFATSAGANFGSPILSVLLVVQMMLGGAILTGLGIVGEYVGRTFEQVKGRPVYVLDSSSDDGDRLPAVRSLRERFLHQGERLTDESSRDVFASSLPNRR